MQSFNYAGQGDSGNEDSTISGFPLTGRAARSIPHPLGWGGRTQFDVWQLRAGYENPASARQHLRQNIIY